MDVEPLTIARPTRARGRFNRLLLPHAQGAGRKVSDIAHTVGFNDLSYFHRAFRRKFGIVPAGCRWNWDAGIERPLPLT
ncbi:helix-turn-helix domain-containing protein [Bradyrhizobium sp. i1.8.4]|uniref:helix-turn-helix domain-containing protein n=1 Tax=Bradyrhizobium sp. i1.8.4 TaxID=3156364 RepID=UPI003D1914EB